MTRPGQKKRKMGEVERDIKAKTKKGFIPKIRLKFCKSKLTLTTKYNIYKKKEITVDQMKC